MLEVRARLAPPFSFHHPSSRRVSIKLIHHSAVFFVRTTMPQTGMFLETWSNLWGRTLNPYNTGFSAGGSSGGDGSLVAMRGAPFCPSTDIGGSIRAPGAFNGNYAIRPTGERTARRGMGGVSPPGQLSIKVSSGPNCHSMADLKLATKVLLTHYGLPFETTAVPIPWKDVPPKTGKLCFGLMLTDGCVQPHPPLVRAMRETAAKLRAAGHEGILHDQKTLRELELTIDSHRFHTTI